MTETDLEDAFAQGLALLIYTSRIGRFVEGYLIALHWPAAPDAFLLEGMEYTIDLSERINFYWIQRSDPSLIIKPA